MSKTTDARADILGRIRAGLRRTPDTEAAARAGMADYLARRPQGPRPDIAEDPVQRFMERSAALASTVERVAAWADVPDACVRYLDAQRLPRQAVAWPQLGALDWGGAGLAVEARAARGDDPVGITGAFCAVAETGTLVLCSGGATPATVSLLPETHIAVVPASRVLEGMEDAWNLMRAELGQDALPRAVNFVSGPSRTGDIEQTIVLGAHGPYRVHIILVQAA
ncbi:MAG: lactate utilization protein C [Pseudomonadota bacterium]|jgi:L-lactate dehydrogenase complex protein LldG